MLCYGSGTLFKADVESEFRFIYMFTRYGKYL